jgi:hypothetical protein
MRNIRALKLCCSCQLPFNSNSLSGTKVFTGSTQGTFRDEDGSDSPVSCLSGGTTAFSGTGYKDTGVALFKTLSTLKRIGALGMINANSYHLPDFIQHRMFSTTAKNDCSIWTRDPTNATPITFASVG